MGWARVQSISTDGNTSGTITATLLSTPTTGNTIYAFCGFNQAGSTATISGVADGNSNALTQVITVFGTGNTVATRGSVFAYTVPATPSKAFTMTVSSTAANGYSILVQEISGSTTTTDGTFGSLFKSTGSPASATYSSTATSEYLVSHASDNGNNTTGPGSNAPTGTWTADANVDLNGNDNCAVYYKNSTGGSETNSWTWSAGGDNATIITGAFQLPGGGGPSLPPDLIMAPMRGNY